LLNRELFARQN